MTDDELKMRDDFINRGNKKILNLEIEK